MMILKSITSTYGHSQLKTGHPVRSAIHKQLNGRLVLRWVTTWESLLLYVLRFSFLIFLLWETPRLPISIHDFDVRRHKQTTVLLGVC
ncbi:hypothetical protein KCU77_g3341, partial [Aureobasidium melanogenum]